MNYTARPYQVEAAAAIQKHFFDGINNQVVELPTGTGKTVLFSILPSLMNIGKRRMLVLVHREELADQAADKLRKWNPNLSVGVEMGNRYADNCQIVVGGVQTLGREGASRLHSMQPEDFAIVITDEAHHAVSDSYQRIFKHMAVRGRKDILNLGVTATTKRADGKGLQGTYDVVSYHMSILKAIKDGWLVDLRGGLIVTGVDLDKIALKQGDFDSAQLSEVLNTKTNNSLIVDHYRKEAKDVKFIAFTEDIAHAKGLAEEFQRSGYLVQPIWGADPDRAAKLLAHRKGELLGLVNCDLLTEGYDDPQIKCVIIDKLTLSESKYKQMVGRGTRLQEGINNLIEARKQGFKITKDDCLILDVVGNSKRHSLNTLPTLFGFGSKTNLNGKTILQAMAEVEEMQKNNPLVTMEGLDNIDSIKSYVESVNLLKTLAPPEIVQLSEFRWQKVSNDAYALPLRNGESVFALEDQTGTWHLSGKVNKFLLEGEFKSLEDAVKEGDYKVRMLGGRMWTAAAKRERKGYDKPADPSVIALLKTLYNIDVPPGTSFGEVDALMSKAAIREQWESMNG